MNNEVKEYWEGYDAAQVEEEEERGNFFTRKREIF